MIILPIIIPLLAGAVVLALPNRIRWVKEIITICATILNLFITIALYKTTLTYSIPWAGFGFEFSLRIYHFSGFIILSTACFGFLISLFSCAFMYRKSYLNQFYSYLLFSVGFVNGAVLSDNLFLLLFFWEGILLTLFGLIAIGNKGAFKTATKTFIIVGIGDLCLLAGIGLTGWLSGTLTISKINLPLNSLGGLAFILLMIGAISKAGSMPFHSWIPDAATDAPLPFMALLPASLEKLLGIYFLTRISLDMFQLTPHSWISTLLMIIGALTLIFAVMMALVQKDYKRLLSYHAISQVGYMILGIGTALPVGIIGGLFHMINNALYKSCLFLTGGAVEKQTGTTDLNKLGGLGLKMPVTFTCFIITALSISGVPPFNGFFSKELLYDAVLHRGLIFYLIAVLGSFFTAASFLKLGHSAFLGKIAEENKAVKEVSFIMLVPMTILAIICIVFGIYNTFPVNKLFAPVLGGRPFGDIQLNASLVTITVVVLIGALLNHIYGFKKTGSGLKAVDHIHYSRPLKNIYEKAEKKESDPYEIVLVFIKKISHILWNLDRAVDWIYNIFSVKFAFSLSAKIRNLHNGSYSTYIIWSLAGTVFVIFILLC